ncbi:MAG: hypothetical protein GY795_11400 [Desulfobacterales bacterium]|nr:hypothetical protein [Desulfobacterales bacterium]
MDAEYPPLPGRDGPLNGAEQLLASDIIARLASVGAVRLDRVVRARIRGALGLTETVLASALNRHRQLRAALTALDPPPWNLPRPKPKSRAEEAPPGTKWCPHGAHYVAYAGFNRNARAKDGLQSYCRACSRVYHRGRYRAAADADG